MRWWAWDGATSTILPASTSPSISPSPGAVRANVEACLDSGVPCIVGTTGLGDDEAEALGETARAAGVALLVAPNFAIGAVLMMRFAEEAARYLPRAEIVEIHHESKRDAPSGTAKATAARLGADVAIHSVRLPGAVAHQEVLLGGPGQLLSRSATTLSPGRRSCLVSCSPSSASQSFRLV